MNTINIHQAKTHLSKLVEQVVQGEPFMIAKAGKPMVKVVPIETPAPSKQKRIGFLAGEIEVPDDFDHLAAAEIEQMFGVK